MLENDFFPTPITVINKMIAPYIWKGIYFKAPTEYPILDPSAGSGAILDRLKELNVDKRSLMAIEVNPDLRFTLQGKKYKVIGTDFLQYDEPMQFGLILMNPPFSNGTKHIPKAWELLVPGGELVALVNSETINNPCHKERELLGHLISDHGSTEDLGQCFKESERPCNVNVTVIRLAKPKINQAFKFDSCEFQMDTEVNSKSFTANPLAHQEVIANLVGQYKACRAILIQRHEMQSKLDFYLNDISSPVYDTVNREECESLTQEKGLNEQLAVLKSRFWNTVFVKTKIQNITTSNFQEKFNSYSQQQSSMAFTEDNIKEMLSLFFMNRSDIMQDCLVEVFDKATAYHEKNKIWVEGWKTNKGYRINKRIIIPWGVNFAQYSAHYFTPNHRVRPFLEDLDKVLCYLSGIPIEKLTGTYQRLQDYCKQSNSTGDYSEPFDTFFFKLKIFKKGTLHIDFKDLDLLNELNYKAAISKKWIGDGS